MRPRGYLARPTASPMRPVPLHARSSRFGAFALAGLVFAGACQRGPADDSAPAGGAVAADTARSEAPTGFSVAREGGADVLTLGSGVRLVLVPHGAPVPEGVAGTVVRVPVRRAVALSTTHLGFFERLGASGALAGVAGARWIVSAGVRQGIEAGRIADVGDASGGVNVEAVASARPDIVLVSAGDDALAGRLSVLGVPVVALAEHREATPVARAAWLRVVGALTGTTARADTAVAGIAVRYAALRDAARRAPGSRPTVVIGAPYRGVWHVPGGATFPARLVADAGGAYLWGGDTLRTALPLSLEAVVARAQGADVWIDPGAWHALADGTADEPRVALFAAFAAGRVWAPDARLSPGGGYAVHETGVVEPDVVLGDLVCIFHPAVRPGCRPVYYRRLE